MKKADIPLPPNRYILFEPPSKFRIQTLRNTYNYIKTKPLINSLGKQVNPTIYCKYFCQNRQSSDTPENRRSQKTKVLKHYHLNKTLGKSLKDSL